MAAWPLLLRLSLRNSIFRNGVAWEGECSTPRDCEMRIIVPVRRMQFSDCAKRRSETLSNPNLHNCPRSARDASGSTKLRNHRISKSTHKKERACKPSRVPLNYRSNLASKDGDKTPFRSSSSGETMLRNNGIISFERSVLEEPVCSSTRQKKAKQKNEVRKRGPCLTPCHP